MYSSQDTLRETINSCVFLDKSSKSKVSTKPKLSQVNDKSDAASASTSEQYTTVEGMLAKFKKEGEV